MAYSRMPWDTRMASWRIVTSFVNAARSTASFSMIARECRASYSAFQLRAFFFSPCFFFDSSRRFLDPLLGLLFLRILGSTIA